MEIEIEYAPRPEYGIVIPLLAPVDRGLLARGGAAVLLLSSPVAWEVTDGTLQARITIREGEVLGFMLQYRSSSDDVPIGLSQEEIAKNLEETVRAWQSWSDIHQSYQGPWKDLVHQSGRVLEEARASENFARLLGIAGVRARVVRLRGELAGTL